MLPSSQLWAGDTVLSEYMPMILYLATQSLFLVILSVCLCKVSAFSKTRKGPQISTTRAKEIKTCFAQRKDDLENLVRDLVISRLNDGPLRFSEQTEKAEKKLFDHVNETRTILTITKADRKVVQQTLKRQFMKYPQDILGGRRLQTVLKIYKMCAGGHYSLGWWEQCRKTDTIPTSGPCFTARRQTIIMCIILPYILMFIDAVVSDILVLVESFSYVVYMGYEGDILISMCIMLTLYYIFSLISFLSSPFLFSMQTAYNAGYSLRDEGEEECSATSPLAFICRFDFSLDESSGEASMQSALQWSFYLLVQLVVGTFGVGESDNYKFGWKLVLSSVLATLSLTLGQFKANKLLSENQTTFGQQICYFLACLASTISSQLLLTSCIVFWLDATQALWWNIVDAAAAWLTGLGFAILYFLLSGIRVSSIKNKFKASRALTAKGFSLFSVFTTQPLHLQCSKTRIVTPNRTYYPGLEELDYLFRENIVSHMVLTMLSIVFFSFSHLLTYLATSSTKDLLYSGQEYKARENFLMAVSVCVPLCWVISQALLQLFLYMDLGSQTCGLVYKFTSNTAPSSDGNNSCVWWHKPKFISEEGSWVVE